MKELYTLRHYDGFDNVWTDVDSGLTLAAAKQLYNKKTQNGTNHTTYNDIDYYKIFPNTTKMLHRTK